MIKKIPALSLLLSAFLLFSCVGVPAPEDIPDTLTPMEYFQRAQDAVASRNDYDTALVYYTTYKERFPQDLQGNVEADYEIGFIHYKLGDYQQAKEILNSIVARYETEEATKLKEWPLILSRKILTKIDSIESAQIIPTV